MRSDRLISLLGLLQRQRSATAAELARDLGVSVRTILRDLDALSAAGVPVYAERGRGGGVRLREGTAARLSGLSPVEAEAIALIAPPRAAGDLALTRTFDSALGKIAASIPAVHRQRAGQTRHRLMFDTTPWFQQAPPRAIVDRLADLRAAVWSDRVCHIDYERGDSTRRRYRVEPYALVDKADLWYVVARARRGMRVFRVSRIHALTITAERFGRDPEFDLPAFWRRWCRRFEANPIARYWVEVDLTADGRAQLLVRYAGWHAQALADWPEDADRHVVTLDLESEEVALRVLFELAGEAHVMAPAGLRRALRARARRLLEDF
jgi:predicted DNA-binding transcriptional regulator YafY